MKKALSLFAFLVLGTAMIFSLSGCKGGEKDGDHPNGDHPKGEHPAAAACTDACGTKSCCAGGGEKCNDCDECCDDDD